MKKLLPLLFALLAAGCSLTDSPVTGSQRGKLDEYSAATDFATNWIATNTPRGDLPMPAPTNAPAVIVAEPQPGTVVVLPDSELVAAGAFARPAIGIHGGTVTVAAEGPGMASIWVYRLEAGKWIGGKRLSGSGATAARVYGLSVADGTSAFRFGPKTGGTWKGPGLIMPSGAVIRTQLTTGAARLATDPKGLILMSKDANWGRVNPDGTTSKPRRFAGLSTGEKIAFDVSGYTWAVGMNGYSKQDASVAVGPAEGPGKVTAVASFKAFPAMGSDLLYCSVVISGPDVWFASSYGGRLRINCVTNGRARWPVTALADLGPCVAGDRCPPRLLAVKGRVFAIWEAPGRSIMRVDVEAMLKGKAKPVRICAGSQPAALVDTDGRVRVVYIGEGGIRCRVLE